MQSNGISVIGEKIVIAKINKLKSLGTRNSQIKAAYNRASKPMRDMAKSGAKRVKDSGTLWRSIKLIQSKRIGLLFWLGPARGKKQTYDAWYAYFIEKGTVNRTTKKKGYFRGRIVGKKFMEPAYNATKGKVRLNIIKELNKLINKLVDAKVQ